MNKKILSISVGAVAVLLVAVVGINLTEQPSKNTYYTGNLPPASSIMELAPKPVSDIRQASLVVGYDVALPSYLPKDYQVRMVSANDENGDVHILASKFPVNSETTDIGFFWKDQGILIYTTKLSAGFDKDKHLSDWAKDNSAKQITINGGTAAVHDIVVGKDIDGNTTYAPAEITFYRGNVLTEVRAMLPADEIVKIAESIK
jgi:hypothetical protein